MPLSILTKNVHGQIYNYSISDKHAVKIEQASSGKEKLKKYHKYFYKDKLNYLQNIQHYLYSIQVC
jgi:hypothetical protein